MKTFKLILLAAVLLMPCYAFSSNLGYMRISHLDGNIQIKTQETGEWELASINELLAKGDHIWVPQNSRAEVQVNNGTYLRFDHDTAIQILSMDKDSSQFYLSQGNIYVYYTAARKNVIQVDTPDASIRASSRAIFRVDMTDQYTDISVYKGYVETETEAGSVGINAGRRLALGQSINTELTPIGPPDEWEKWNKERNDRIVAGRGEVSRYLPPELRAYSYDLENNGRWVQVPDYGYVWIPTVGVNLGWSPYREGRWIWQSGEYVWMPYEPWGWAPYHYGRWSFFAHIGWCWVPPVSGEVYWGPGYVGWGRTADYVAWVPLAPGEIYYGRGYYGKHSVNIANTDINRLNLTNAYKNVHVNNGVTVVKHDTFNTASPGIVNLDKTHLNEIFMKNNMSAGAPVMAPVMKPSNSPVPAKQPFQSHGNPEVRELKNSRPFIKEQPKSTGKTETIVADKQILRPADQVESAKRIGPAFPENIVRPNAVPYEKKPRTETDGQLLKPTQKSKPISPENLIEKQHINGGE